MKTNWGEEEGRQIARQLSDALNKSAGHVITGFIEFWKREHPTLQQLFTCLVAEWLLTLSKREYCDDRNRNSVEFARRVLPVLREAKFPVI